MKSYTFAIFIIFIVFYQVYSIDEKSIEIDNFGYSFIQKSEAYGSYSISVKPNPKLKITKELKLKNFRSIKCEVKSGVLNHLKSKKGNSLIVSPAFISLTKTMINFFESFDKSTLFESIRLDTVERITQIYTNSNCFDIQSRANRFSALKITTLCAKKRDQVNEWISSILDMKKCKIIVHTVEIKNHQEQDIQYRDKATVAAEKLQKLAYSSANKVYPQSQKKLVKKSVITTQMKKLLKTVREGSLAQRSLKRKMASRLKNVRTVSQDVIRKEEQIKMALEQKSSIERERQLSMIKLEKKQKEMALIRRAQRKIRKEKLKELKDTKKYFKNLINYQKLEAKKQAYTVLKLIKNQRKLENWSKCEDSRLLLFRDKEFITSFCQYAYGESGLKKCTTENHFCRMCCNFHIGINHSNVRNKCMRRCDRLIKGNKKPANRSINRSKEKSNKRKGSRKSKN